MSRNKKQNGILESTCMFSIAAHEAKWINSIDHHHVAMIEYRLNDGELPILREFYAYVDSARLYDFAYHYFDELGNETAQILLERYRCPQIIVSITNPFEVSETTPKRVFEQGSKNVKLIAA